MVRDTGGDRSPRSEGLSPLPERFRSPSSRGAPAGEEARPAGDEAPGAPGVPPSDASVIDRHSTFDGRYETAHDLRIEGTISGEIICRGSLYIEREAIAKVKVEAREIHVFGQLEGEIDCSEKFVLADTATVSGTIKTGTLVIHEGAMLNGSVEMGEGEPDSGRRRRTSRRAGREEEAADSSRAPSFSLNAADAEAKATPDA